MRNDQEQNERYIYESIEAKGLKKLNVNNYYAVVNLPCKEIDGW